MATDTVLHFGLEQAGALLVWLGFRICPHFQHRWIRRVIIAGADLVLAYVCVRVIG